MQVEFLAESAIRYKGDAVVVGVVKGAQLQGAIAEVDAALDGLLGKLVASGEIRGRQSEVTVVHTCGRLPSERVTVVGLGEPGSDPLLAMRRAAGAAARELRNRGCRRVGFAVDLASPQIERIERRKARAIIEGVYSGLYRSGECKREQELSEELDTLALLGLASDRKEAVELSGRAGAIAGEATNYVRRLVNLPPNVVTPTRLTQEARDSAEAYGLEVEVLGIDQIIGLGMGAFAAVASGSEEPAHLIVLRHRRQGGGPTAPGEGPHVALVGKGLTFDSGGLSIKPSDKLEQMKQDMAGGAAVIGAMRAIAQLKLGVDVTGIVPATENLPSGRAFKPGDVVTAMNGKTIEVISTDAEGRLILADALAYALQLGATHVIDVATLTGACIIALGHVASGVMGNDTALVDAVIDAGDRAGERMWRLPLFPEYRAQLDSAIADIKNVGGRPAGTITGGWFLRQFVGDTAWVHIDIAGTAWSEKDEPHQIEGATGASTRTLIALAERMAGVEV